MKIITLYGRRLRVYRQYPYYYVESHGKLHIYKEVGDMQSYKVETVGAISCYVRHLRELRHEN